MEPTRSPFIPLAADHADSVRGAELVARERDLAVRAVSLSALEARLAASGRRLERLEARIREAKSAVPAVLGFQLPARSELPKPPPGYFAPETAWDEDAWWSNQLGAGSAA